MPNAFEVNFDGLVGPTHNYAGLSYGNLASQRHRNAVAHPKGAALQGLAKMKLLADLGVKQAVLPPQERPDVRTLRRLGFAGNDAQVLERARKADPVLLAACGSASGMWAANAATVSPGWDTADRRVHFTPANLVSQFHRALEAETTGNILRAIFRNEERFAVHPPLPASAHFGDEGAANHTRLVKRFHEPGLEVFVYGRCALEPGAPAPARFPARQTREASEAIARLHQLDPDRAIFVQQNPAAIDAGAFHNDVVAVGNLNVLLYHESAFLDSQATACEIREKFERLTGDQPHLIEVPDQEVPLADAIRSYLFNSQLISLPDGTMALICPTECRDTPSSWSFLERLTDSEGPIQSIHFVDVRQSMNNGGGPACLRLRVALDEADLAKAAPRVFLTEQLCGELTAWIGKHYRESLTPDDLADTKLLEESRAALDELTRILNLGAIYPFQRE